MRILSAILAISMGGLAASANAGQWNLTYDGYGSSLVTNISYNASASWDAAPAGSFNAIRVGSHLFSTGNLSYETFCVQIFEGLTVGDTICFDEVAVSQVPDASPAPGPMGALKATLVQDLYWRFYDYTTDESVDAATADTRYAAFQIALYEVTHESIDASDAAGALAQLGLGQGAFQAAERTTTPGSADAISLAAQMLAELGTDGFHFFGSGLKGLTNPTFQDQLVIVPVPAAVGLAAAGLLGLGAVRRRMNARAKH
jgi:hypothetical protein